VTSPAAAPPAKAQAGKAREPVTGAIIGTSPWYLLGIPFGIGT